MRKLALGHYALSGKLRHCTLAFVIQWNLSNGHLSWPATLAYRQIPIKIVQKPFALSGHLYNARNGRLLLSYRMIYYTNHLSLRGQQQIILKPFIVAFLEVTRDCS